MELVTGALGTLIPKLWSLLKEEYKLQTGVKDQVRSLALELESAHATLRKVANVRPDQLDELVKIWAREVRDASYDMEDILDTYLVRVDGSGKHNGDDGSSLRRLTEKMSGLFKKSKVRHEIAGAIETIMKNLHEVVERHGRYTVDNIVAKPAASLQCVDPRLTAMHREASQIIGIEKPSADLMSLLLSKEEDGCDEKMKIVSVVGVGGLGETTLAKAVYDQLKSKFDYGAFVPVGQDPDMKKVFIDMLIELDKQKYTDSTYTMLDERQLINEIHDFLGAKRYFIVIDDIWEPQSWETIKLALMEKNCGSRMIITTRKFEVAKEAEKIYKLQPLPIYDSKRLFYTRLFGGQDKCPKNHPHDLCDQILMKCDGVPLAIITMASLLLGKSRQKWIEVCSSPGFCQDKDDRQMKNTMHILSLSYYDLPSHLKPCLLYLSVFPEDSLIDQDSLIWMWIAEGFVENKQGCWLFEIGEEYFHDLVNRSMIQGVSKLDVMDICVDGAIDGCRVHDMVLDLIISKSKEENFASADGTLPQRHTRRLALKNRELDLTLDTDDANQPKVRSFIVWQCAIVKWALHPSLKLIRVLALEGCTFREGCQNLEHIGDLLHLRYLGIQGLLCKQLPEAIGGLKFLQTLNLMGTQTLVLPRSIAKLTQLVCLRVPWISLPVGVIGNLTSLQELRIEGRGANVESVAPFAKDLGNLCDLRVLSIDFVRRMDERTQIDLMQSLRNLKKMQHLVLKRFLFAINMNAWDAAVPSIHLRCLFLPNISFPRLPSWINSAHLPSLSQLKIIAYDLDEQGLKALGGLPELTYLKLVYCLQ